MCYGCYEDAGKPAIVNDRTRQAAKLIADVYEHNDMAGNLHVQLDDWNLEDQYFDEYTIWDEDSTPDQILAERVCFELLKDLTTEERYTAVAMYCFPQLFPTTSPQ